MEQVLDFISFVPWTSLIMLINVYILYRIVRRFLFKPVQELFRKRQEEIDGIFNDAKNSRAEANDYKTQYEMKNREIESQVVKIIADAETEANEYMENSKVQAKKTSEEMIRKAEKEINLMEKKAVWEARQEVSGLVVDIAKQVLEKEIDGDEHDRLIANSLHQMEKSLE
ncbi:MAG: F0F1 ATP synthase subunit B [Lachnospiraceae bacterium]